MPYVIYTARFTAPAYVHKLLEKGFDITTDKEQAQVFETKKEAEDACIVFEAACGAEAFVKPLI